MKAIIMAGGEGTRLRPLTCDKPKPMVPIMNKPVMEHIINLLKKHNITEIGVTLQYMPQVIQEYFGDGSEFGVNLNYFIENKPLGTAGSVKNTGDFLDETFLVISGDSLTDLDITKAIEFHHLRNSDATLVLTRVDSPLEYGIIITDSDGSIIRFLEKPSWSEVFSDTVNTGIYILNPDIFDYFKMGDMFDFSRDLFPILLNDNRPMFGHIMNGYWCDIGDLKAYQRCNFDILAGKVDLDINAKEVWDNVWFQEGVRLGDNVRIKGPVLIGRNVKIKDNATISEYTIVERDVKIGENASIKRSILWDGCKLGANTQLRGATLCSKVNVGENTSIYEHAVVGERTLIKNNVTIKPEVKVWPGKVIESETEVNSNLVWGTKHSKVLFGDKGIVGEVNIDITPEFVSKLGTAYGVLLNSKTGIAVSSDSSNVSEMIRRSFISGVLSSGTKVFDFGSQILPMTRFAVRFYGLDGGIHFGMTNENPSHAAVDLLDANGLNIKRGLERKLETIFTRDDFQRCDVDDVKSIRTIRDFKCYYLRNIINNTKNKPFGYKLLIGSSSEMITEIISPLMDELGCNFHFIKLNNSSMGLTSHFRFERSKSTHKYEGNHKTPRNDIQRLSQLTMDSDYNLGVFIEENSEKIVLIDEKGRIVTEDMFIVLVSFITFNSSKNATIVVPISAPAVIDIMAKQYNGKVIRTKTSVSEMMSSMVSDRKELTMNEQFILNFDAVGSLVRVMNFMKNNDMSLSKLIDNIPEFHIVKREVQCGWDSKGKVIREIIEESKDDKMELMEGVKIFRDGGWVLVLPDMQRPICKVIGEGLSEEFAQEITGDFAEKIERIGKKRR
jgi:mannose-1-phosphate guanylyltransferase/phosphomannomutase